MRTTCKAVLLVGTLVMTLGLTSARAQGPATPATRGTGAPVLRDPTTLRAAIPTTSSYWGSKPATAPTNTRPSAWQRFKNRFARTEGGGQHEGTPVYRDPTTGRTNLTLAKPWMQQAR